eukprot:TRINITY_DN18546_c0_g1_i2.p2 TRINITY_DN18546_c0_g1~~TRINITY_DN18546_c0_g1_i2.p2  ORF type:complete len:281 (-),score=57.31 TRINITY_DN18546_c0_g1_i2:15-857(-)
MFDAVDELHFATRSKGRTPARVDFAGGSSPRLPADWSDSGSREAGHLPRPGAQQAGLRSVREQGRAPTATADYRPAALRKLDEDLERIAKSKELGGPGLADLAAAGEPSSPTPYEQLFPQGHGRTPPSEARVAAASPSPQRDSVQHDAYDYSGRIHRGPKSPRGVPQSPRYDVAKDRDVQAALEAQARAANARPPAERLKACPRCQSGLLPGAKFCRKCGQPRPEEYSDQVREIDGRLGKLKYRLEAKLAGETVEEDFEEELGENLTMLRKISRKNSARI